MRKIMLSLLLLFALPAMGQTIAIRAGNLIDPANGSVSKNQIILVQNGKITAVGAGISIPQDAQTIDLSNEWVMPGPQHAALVAPTHARFAGCRKTQNGVRIMLGHAHQ